jgi:hypothetical protein
MNELERKVLEAFGIDVEQAKEKLRDIMVIYPEGAERLAVVEDFIRAYATPEAIAAIPGTLAGIAKDVATGMTGRDPNAWAGSG